LVGAQLPVESGGCLGVVDPVFQVSLEQIRERALELAVDDQDAIEDLEAVVVLPAVDVLGVDVDDGFAEARDGKLPDTGLARARGAYQQGRLGRLTASNRVQRV